MTEPEDTTPKEESLFHHYTGNDIPWYVRAIWIGFWMFAVDWTKLRRFMLEGGVVGVVLIALVVWVNISYRSRRRQLTELEQAGLKRAARKNG